MFDFGPLPYFSPGPWRLGPITIHAFGIMVAIGVFWAHERALRRAGSLGLDPARMRSLLTYLLLAGFVGAHVFDVIWYRPAELLEKPWLIFWIPGSMSSYGGITGALIGMALWQRKHKEATLFAYSDVAAFVLPLGWFFGRLGCSLAHDHPGALTDFPLAVDFGLHAPGGVRHDLGIYEALWWLVLLSVFQLLDRRRHVAGLYLAALPLLYAPARFLLDFLRAPASEGGDPRYLGLTPGQYISLVAFGGGLWLLVRWRERTSP